MSIKAMDEVLSRIVRDKAFRDLLRHDPEHALVGYDLTPQERANLAKLKKRARQTRPTKPGHSFSLN